MSGFGKLIQGAMVAPPNGATEVAVSTTALSATAMPSTKPDAMVSFICTMTFNIDTGTSTVGEPSANYYFAANTLYSFNCGPGDTHFRVKASAAGSLKYWRSTRA